MKKMKHGGKARKSHKRMQDGGIASFGGMPASLDQRPGMYRPVGRPGRGNEGMYRPIGRPGRGGPMGGGAFSDIQGGGGGGLSKIVDGGAMGRPIRGGGMTSDIGSVPMGRGGAMASMEAQPVRLPARGRGASGLQKEVVGGMSRPLERPGMKGSLASIMGAPGRGGAMTSDAGSVPMGRGGSIGGATGYQAGGGMTSDADSVPMGRGFRKGGAVKAKKNMRGGGLARKGVGMALAKGGLAKRAGGCAKRGVGRGKMV